MSTNANWPPGLEYTTVESADEVMAGPVPRSFPVRREWKLDGEPITEKRAMELVTEHAPGTAAERTYPLDRPITMAKRSIPDRLRYLAEQLRSGSVTAVPAAIITLEMTADEMEADGQGERVSAEPLSDADYYQRKIQRAMDEGSGGRYVGGVTDDESGEV